MTCGFDLRRFEEAVADFRFGDATELLEDAAETDRPGLSEKIDQERERAADRAQHVYQRIVAMGTADDQAGIHALVGEPATARLLELLPDDERRRADLYLRAADRWAAALVGRNRRRLSEAERAVRAFDLDLARGLLALVDGDHLDADMALTRDRLLLEIEARAMEMDSLREARDRVVAGARPRARRWWRRRRG